MFFFYCSRELSPAYSMVEVMFLLMFSWIKDSMLTAGNLNDSVLSFVANYVVMI